MIMSNMTATQHLEIIREKNRPTVNDYIPAIFNHFTELHGDRHYGDDAAILSFGKITHNGKCQRQGC